MLLWYGIFLMNEDELVSNLQDFGLSQDESEIYVGLLRVGSSRVSQISNFIQINRVKGYRILENLKKRGLVSSTFSNPTVYSANDLKDSLSSLVDAKKFEVERLGKITDFISKNYETPDSALAQTNNPNFAIISGRYNIYKHIEKMIREATKELYIVTTAKDLSMMYFTTIPEVIQEAQKNGITIRIVYEVEKKQDFKILKKMKIDNYRIANLPSKGRIVCGQLESLVSGHTTKNSGLNSEGDSALVTNSEEFVSNMHCLCWQLWKSGEELYQLEQSAMRN